MLKQSSPPRLKAQRCKPAQPRALVKHSEESPPMRLEEAAGYFSSRLPRAFRVIEGVDSPNKGSEGVQLAKGEYIAAGPTTLVIRTSLRNQGKN